MTAIGPRLVETEFVANVYKSEGFAQKLFGGSKVLQPEDIASMVRYVLSCPPHVQLHDTLVRSTDQKTGGVRLTSRAVPKPDRSAASNGRSEVAVAHRAL